MNIIYIDIANLFKPDVRINHILRESLEYDPKSQTFLYKTKLN